MAAVQVSAQLWINDDRKGGLWEWCQRTGIENVSRERAGEPFKVLLMMAKS